MRSGLARVTFGLLGVVFGLSAVGLALRDGQGATAQTSGPLAFRLTLAQLAADSAASASPPSAATPTPTRTPTPTQQATATRSSTPTSTPAGGSAYALLQSWYDHINVTLFGRYTAILAKQSIGQLSPAQAGAALIAEKGVADAFGTFVDAQAAGFAGASSSCGYARQYLGLAASWLGLMEGWGGLILTYGAEPSYVSSRQQASDSYFESMSKALEFMSTCTGSATAGSPPGVPPSTVVPSATATPTVPAAPTATPTSALPTVPPGGGTCSGTKTTANWWMRVTAGGYFGDLFIVTVTPLTEAATESTFKVRVYDPGFGSADSSTKYPFSVGQNFTLDYGSDFSEYGPYPSGTYQVQLRVDFLSEMSIYVTCP